MANLLMVFSCFAAAHVTLADDACRTDFNEETPMGGHAMLQVGESAPHGRKVGESAPHGRESPSHKSEVHRRRTELERLVPSLIDQAFNSTTGDIDGTITFDAMHSGSAKCFGSKQPAMVIISLVADFKPEYVRALRHNRVSVALAQNYKYCEYSHTLDTGRDIAWSKIIAVRHLLKSQSLPVIWMDADAIFTANKRFESITDKPLQTKDIVFTDDLKGRINTGVFVTKTTTWTQKFWTSVYNDFPEALHHPWWDQQAVLLYQQRNPSDFAQHTKIVPHRRMNAVDSYTGDFIAHPAGGHARMDKYDVLQEILDEQRATGILD